MSGAVVDATACAGGLGVCAWAPFAGALEEAGALVGGGDQSCVPHVEGLEKAVVEKRGIGFACGGGEGVSEEIEADVGVEGGGAGRRFEALIGKPVPAVFVIGEGEVGSFAGVGGDFAGQAGGVCGEIEEGDGVGVEFWNELPLGGVALEGVVEFDFAVGDEAGEQVGGEELRRGSRDGSRSWRRGFWLLPGAVSP